MFGQGEQPAGREDRAGRGSSEGVWGLVVLLQTISIDFLVVGMCTCLPTCMAVSGAWNKEHGPLTGIMSGP